MAAPYSWATQERLPKIKVGRKPHVSSTLQNRGSAGQKLSTLDPGHHTNVPPHKYTPLSHITPYSEMNGGYSIQRQGRKQRRAYWYVYLAGATACSVVIQAEQNRVFSVPKVVANAALCRWHRLGGVEKNLEP